MSTLSGIYNPTKRAYNRAGRGLLGAMQVALALNTPDLNGLILVKVGATPGRVRPR
jgi:hypothetical protein